MQVPHKIIVNTNGQICVTLEMTSEQCLRDYVRNLINNKFTNGELVVPSYSKKGKTYNLFLIEQFTQILRMRLFPQEGALVGTKFDVFGIWKAIKSQYSPIQFEYKSFSDEKHTEYKNSEVAEVKKRTIASLKKELGVEITSKGYFEIPYNREKLAKILSKYYFKESFKKEDKDYHHEFLTSSPSKLMKYCAPQKSQENNIAIDLPYFWCRGKECFHNNLENQMLAECDDWHKYSLYHLAEIIGYPKLHITDAGYEPDAIVRNFIAIANKVVQKFHSLKCRNCGHLMFTDKANGFNRYNWFACVNPTCENFRASVYINFCYNCKKGLIDSRDTAKCSNGWYICPTCLSCCDDEQYERLAQRYILSNRPIPDRIKEKLGCGHNDKSIYFCPKCGTKLEEIVEHDETYRGCPKCHQKFNIMK